MRGHRQRRFARSWIWAALAVAIGFPVILSTGLAGALAGTLLGARGTAVVGLLFTGVTAWIGACLFLAAPRATFAAGAVKIKAPVLPPLAVVGWYCTFPLWAPLHCQAGFQCASCATGAHI